MERITHRMLCLNRSTNPTHIFRNRANIFSSKRGLCITSIRHAKPPKTPPKAPATKPSRQRLEYKTPTRKTPLPSSPTQSTSSKGPNPLRHRTIPIIFLSITAFAISSYSTYLYITIFRKPLDPSQTGPSNFTTQDDVSSRYDSIAAEFDDQVSLTERLMGITALRRKLAARAHGDVLEVSIGTGRNLEFYDWDFKGFNGVGKVQPGPGGGGDVKRGRVRSFTAVDQSAEMLEVAHDKFSKLFPGILGVRWVVGDAAAPGTIPPPPPPPKKNSRADAASEKGSGASTSTSSSTSTGNSISSASGEGAAKQTTKKYDTIIQTMGLCSVKDPIALLRNLGECVADAEEGDANDEGQGGRIILLEHGRARWGWLNGVLDRFAEGHARAFGCWWNRDLGAVVAACGLEVVRVERPGWWHGGTTWWIELRKPVARSSSTSEAEAETVVEEKANGSGDGQPAGGGGAAVVKASPTTATKGWWS